MDAAWLAVGFVVGVLVRLLVRFLLPTLADVDRRPTTAPARLDGHSRHGRPLRREAAGVEPEAPDDGEEPSEAGPYARLAAQVGAQAEQLRELQHSFKLIQNEWADKESRMDALIKRAWRLHKIAGGPPADVAPDANPAPVLSAAEQRAEIVRRFRKGGE